MSFTEDFQHLKITLEAIKLATDNFSSSKLIGHGGFGCVYKGQLSLSSGLRRSVAFKRLDPRYGQGNVEFWKEVMTLSKYKHKNLISLLHFCDEGDERILVYEYASHGSLNGYLSDPKLTWIVRIQICLGAASALNYLHDPMGTQQRLIHRDIKSANILIDGNWTAKVSDFGLSKVGPANQSKTYLLSHAVGTFGYCDPMYSETGFLSKESDVYSFGVVLFEVMCGKLCCEYHNCKLSRIYVNEWRNCCYENKLDDIIFEGLKQKIDVDSLKTFSAIANRCLTREPKERPTMAEIIKELETALEQQKFHEDGKELVKIAELAHLSYKSREKLFSRFSKGILLSGEDSHDTWLSRNKNGKVCEMISARDCVSGGWFVADTTRQSRFKKDIKCATHHTNFKVDVSTRFLMPHVTYTINLIFKHERVENGAYVPFRYKLHQERRYSNSSVVHLREDGWLMTELYHFTSNQRAHNFMIDFVGWPMSAFSARWCHLEGFEFCPLETNI